MNISSRSLALFALLLLAVGLAVAPVAVAAPAGGAGVDQYTGGGDDGDGDDDGTTGGGDTEDVSGPLGGASASVDGDGDGTFEGGESATIEGDISFEEGASITFEDEDGTQGTFTDNGNAQFSIGSLVVTAESAPTGVSGGDGVLSDAGLSVVSSSGITTGGGSANDAAGSLPSTGGEFAWLAVGLLVLVGSGLALRRVTRTRPDSSS